MCFLCDANAPRCGWVTAEDEDAHFQALPHRSAAFSPPDLANFDQFQQLWQESPQPHSVELKPKKRARVAAGGLEEAACIGEIDPPHLRRPARTCTALLGMQN